MGKRENAQKKILRMLRQYGKLSIHDAISILNTSGATVRRYFSEMEQQGLLFRIHGGARLPVVSNSQEYLFQREAGCRVLQKQKIGQAAAESIVSHDRIFFDSGTTVRECGCFLSERLKREELSDVGVVTNSLAYSDSLALYCPVTLTGGTIRTKRMDLCGLVALANLERYNFTKAILGTDGILADGTLTTTDEETSRLAAAAMQHSESVIILADSSKLGKSSFVPCGSLSGKKFTLITDSQADPAIVEQLKALDINLILT